jgi:hypothetical protein
MKDLRKKPAPSAVAPARYHVGTPPPGAQGASAWHPRHGEGSFAAPLGDSPQDLAVRVHEYGHLYCMRNLLHPRKPDSVLEELEKLGALTPRAPIIVQVAVDAYVQGVLHRKGLGDSISPIPVKMAAEDSPDLVFDVVRAFLQSMGTASEEKAREKAYQYLPEKLYETAYNVARAMHEKGWREERLSPKGLASILAPLLLMIDPPNGADGGDQAMVEYAGSMINPYGGDEEAEWGDFEVRTVPLASPRRVRPSRAFRGGYVGAPVYWSRFPPAGDGAVFRTRRPTSGGTVLIDISGSMQLSQEDIEALVAQAPGLTVAVYASYRKTSRGAVTVVARGGRVANMSDVLEIYGGGNVVDGPALEWLGRQPGPRVWVSDGLVTGRYEIQSPKLVLDALRICRKYNIRRIEPKRDTNGRLVLEGI